MFVLITIFFLLGFSFTGFCRLALPSIRFVGANEIQTFQNCLAIVLLPPFDFPYRLIRYHTTCVEVNESQIFDRDLTQTVS